MNMSTMTTDQRLEDEQAGKRERRKGPSPQRAATAPRRPVHLAVMAGAAAGLYAVSLAGVTALQAATDAEVAAARDPIAAAISEQQAQHDRLDAAVGAAAAAYAKAAASYTEVLEALGGHESELAALEGVVAKAEGSAAALVAPARLTLPTIRSTVSTRTVSRPATNASTGASGGG
jgi:hypothetical protein